MRRAADVRRKGRGAVLRWFGIRRRLVRKPRSIRPGLLDVIQETGKLAQMKATIDIPDDLYRRIKARAAEQGRRIREVTIELFLGWLAGEEPRQARRETGVTKHPGRSVGLGDEVPVVRAEDLAGYPDAESLWQAFPKGYRLVGPLLPTRGATRPLRASAMTQALASLDQQELNTHARLG